MHGAEHRDVGVMFDHGAQFGFVTRAAELIQNYAGDADIAIECLVAEDQRGDAACHAAGVDDQHHRRGQQVGERGVGVRAIEIETVVQSFVAFDEADIRARRACSEGAQDFIAPHEEEVEVVAVAAGGAREPQGIDVVRPFLNGCTARPRARNAAHRPSVSVVLPEDLWAAEMSRRFMS